MTLNTSSLPRDLDVQVTVSKPSIENALELSLMAFCTPNAKFDQGGDRIHTYLTLAAVLEDFDSSSEAYKAATAFFSQPNHPTTFAVGRIFESACKGFLETDLVGNDSVAAWKVVTNGAFKITINGITKTISNLTFATVNDLQGVASVIQTAVRAADTSDGFKEATVTYNPAKFNFRFTSGEAGDSSTVSYLSSANVESSTDISGENFLNGQYREGSSVQGSKVVDGYLPGSIDSEMSLIQSAAQSYGLFVYGWALDASYRDDDRAILAATWAEAQTYAILGLTTNSPLAYSSDSESDIAAVIHNKGFRRTFVNFHNNPYYYPEVSIMAYMLSVNYFMQDSAVTAKFKTLYGIPTVPVSYSELVILERKRCNTYTLIGTTSRTFREGTESDDSWFIDDLINLDNLRERVQVNVYNVFLLNKKVPYNAAGVSKIYTAIKNACDQFVKNGVLSDRELSEAEAISRGETVEPAYTISMTALGTMTPSERAKRIGPPASVKVNLAGAIHSVSIAIEAYA